MLRWIFRAKETEPATKVQDIEATPHELTLIEQFCAGCAHQLASGLCGKDDELVVPFGGRTNQWRAAVGSGRCVIAEMDGEKGIMKRDKEGDDNTEVTFISYTEAVKPHGVARRKIHLVMVVPRRMEAAAATELTQALGATVPSELSANGKAKEVV